MTDDAFATPHWSRRPLYKYGILLVLVLLFLGNFRFGSHSAMIFVTAGLLIVNHVSSTFLDPAQHRRIGPLLLVANLGVVAYIAVSYWQVLKSR